MMRSLNRVVITGAARGLGLALVREFSAHGWIATGIARSERPDDYPDGTAYVQMDAADLVACKRLWSELAAETPGGLDGVVLINNAGLYIRSKFRETAPEQFEASIRANYLSGVHMTRTLVDIAAQARILNIISTSAQQARGTNSAYGSAKAGMAQFFRSMQQEFAPSTYRITNLYPGTLRTHGEGPEIDAIEPEDLSVFIRELVEPKLSFYIAEATILPRGPAKG